MITVTYRVEVQFVNGLVRTFGRDTDFIFALTNATRGCSAAGRGQDGPTNTPYEWAEFNDHAVAERCEIDLIGVNEKFSKRLRGGMVV